MPGTKDPTNPSRFKKGRSGNPAGSSKRYRELKGLERISHRDVCQLGTDILNGKLEDLAKLKDDPNANVHKIWLATLVVSAIQTRNYRAYHMLMDRIVGKPREYAKVEHTGEGGGPVKTQVVPTSIEAIDEELRKLRREAEDLGDD